MYAHEMLSEWRKEGHLFPCRNCGKDVTWMTAKSGKKYLAQPYIWEGEYAERIISPAHRCEPNPEYQAQRAIREAQAEAQRQTDLADGKVIKGQRVVVARGRKVPKGTEGVLTWIAKEVDAYGNLRAGVKGDDGEMIWVNLEYLVSKKDWDYQQANPAPARKREKQVIVPLGTDEEWMI